MTESLSVQQARKLVLLSQRLPPSKKKSRAIVATLSTIEHLGYIQIDTISAVQRAHHHTLWNRNPRYSTSHLDQLLDEKQVFEQTQHSTNRHSTKHIREELYIGGNTYFGFKLKLLPK